MSEAKRLHRMIATDRLRRNAAAAAEREKVDRAYADGARKAEARARAWLGDAIKVPPDFMREVLHHMAADIAHAAVMTNTDGAPPPVIVRMVAERVFASMADYGGRNLSEVVEIQVSRSFERREIRFDLRIDGVRRSHAVSEETLRFSRLGVL